MAAVRRLAPISGEFRQQSMVLTQGAAALPQCRRQWQKPAKIAAFFRLFVLGKVDRNRSRTLYRSSWVRRRLGALARPRSPSLFYTVTEHRAMLVAMFASPRRMRGGCGCLTSESEERETWTAESLRAAFRAGESLRANGQDETSAVDVSGQHLVA